MLAQLLILFLQANTKDNKLLIEKYKTASPVVSCHQQCMFPFQDI